ncbi:MAG: cytochrome C oxidase subunit I, partial [Rhodothermales bacterium]|nr:cytochrome C oxidase subunit I [Rhodothermales bacterium]
MRTCDTTGLPVFLRAQFFIKANAVAAVVFLLVGAIGAILLALTRWSAVHLLSDVMYYRVLTLHGINMLIFWILFFEVAVLYFCCTTLLNTKLASNWVAWLSFVLMIVGALMTNYIILVGQGDVLMTSYPPLMAHPLFYLGMILVAVGALVGIILF